MLSITPRAPYDFSQVYRHLALQEHECLFSCENGAIYRAIRTSAGITPFSVSWENNALAIAPLGAAIGEAAKVELCRFVARWLNTEHRLDDFYAFAKNNDLLAPLVARYHGLPVLGLPNLFEAFSWAIIGQQINLTFAHKVKRQFVEAFGDVHAQNGRAFYVFPTPEQIVHLSIDELKTVQLSKQKAMYLLNVAEFLLETKDDLFALSFDELLHRFLGIKGIGSWTANYVLMKSFHFPQSYPHLDVGLHNAIKALRGMPRKPSADEALALGESFGEWKAYATFYLWRSLADI